MRGCEPPSCKIKTKITVLVSNNTQCRESVTRIFNISSWALNEDNGPSCSGYNMKMWDGRPRQQYIDLVSRRCGSICDNNTLKNTIHLKVKYDEFNERSVSFPISCKTRGKTEDGREYIKYVYAVYLSLFACISLKTFASQFCAYLYKI